MALSCKSICWFQERPCRITLLVLSVIIFLLGIVVIILGVKVYGSSVFKDADANVKKISLTVVVLMLLFASSAILTAVLGGIATKFFNKKVCVGLFGLWAGVVAILYLIAGIILFVLGSKYLKLKFVDYTDDMLIKFCNGSYRNSKAQFFVQTVIDIDNATSTYPGYYMCTDLCPCPQETNFGLWNNMTRLHNHNRTTNDSDLSQYRMLTLATGDDIVYRNFSSCFATLIDIQENQKTSDNYQYLTLKMVDISQSLLAFLSFLEGSFACNGVCEPGIFFFFMDVVSGPPTMNCIDGLQIMFQENTTNIGAALIISFVFTFSAFIVQFSFWRPHIEVTK